MQLAESDAQSSLILHIEINVSSAPFRFKKTPYGSK